MSLPAGTPRRRGRTGRNVRAALLAVPLVEIAVAVLAAQVVGAGWVVLAVLVLSALGVPVVRRAVTGAGRTVLRDGAAVSTPAGRPPVDTALLLAAGALLLFPGLVTGAVGLLLLLPGVRALLRPALGRPRPGSPRPRCPG